MLPLLALSRHLLTFSSGYKKSEVAVAPFYPNSLSALPGNQRALTTCLLEFPRLLLVNTSSTLQIRGS